MKIIEKMTLNPKQGVIIMVILLILTNMMVEIIKVIYHRICFYIVFLSFC